MSLRSSPGAEKPLLPIGEVARRFDVRVSALRYYDELGVLTPAERRGGRRWYGEAQLERLALIQLLQSGGLTLSEVAETIAGPDAGRTWHEVLDQRIAVLDAQIAQAQAARATLAHFTTCPSRHPVAECTVLAAELATRVAARLGR